VPDLSRLTSLQELTIEFCSNFTTLTGIRELAALRRLTFRHLHAPKEVALDLAGLTALQELTIELGNDLSSLSGIGELAALEHLTLVSLWSLEKVPDLARLTSLQELTIDSCDKISFLPGIGKLAALKRLKLVSLRLKEVSDIGELVALEHLELASLSLEEVPNLARLTALQTLTISELWRRRARHIGEISDILPGIGELVALEHLELASLSLEEVPNLARLTALQTLTISEISDLESHSEHLTVLLEGIGKLVALKQVSLRADCNSWYLAPEVPDLGRLTELQELSLKNCRLQKLPLRIVQLSALIKLNIFHSSSGIYAAAGSEAVTRDVLAIGRALKAWPLPNLVDFSFQVGRDDISLSMCWRELGLPAEAAAWNNAATLDFLRLQQHKVAAFASGLHGRLGAASGVSMLNDQILTMIANEVLGRSDFHKWLSLWERQCLEQLLEAEGSQEEEDWWGTSQEEEWVGDDDEEEEDYWYDEEEEEEDYGDDEEDYDDDEDSDEQDSNPTDCPCGTKLVGKYVFSPFTCRSCTIKNNTGQ
jgi:Leucine-rich repeat (LRR) protein